MLVYPLVCVLCLPVVLITLLVSLLCWPLPSLDFFLRNLFYCLFVFFFRLKILGAIDMDFEALHIIFPVDLSKKAKLEGVVNETRP